jgi:hypothetical protein
MLPLRKPFSCAKIARGKMISKSIVIVRNIIADLTLKAL